MPRYLSKICLVFSLAATTGLHTASAQDYDWSDEDLPEWVEDFGYEDADYDGPVSEAGTQPRAGASGIASPTGQRRCCQCDYIFCREKLTGDWCGHRSCLQQCGITYRGRLTQFFFGVADGIQEPIPPQFAALGIAGGDQFEYTGNSQHDFLIDKLTSH